MPLDPKRPRMKPAVRLLILILAWASAAGVAGAQSLVVVTTIHPLAAIARELGGEWLDVHALLPPGASPHTFEARPAHMRAIAGASLILAVGQGLDDWVADLARSAGKGELLLVGDHVAAAGLGIGYEEIEEHHHDVHAEDGNGHTHDGAIDPHVWLDPVIVRDVIAPVIAERLGAAHPDRRDEVERNLAALQEELTRLDAWIAERLSSYEPKAFISYHSAWRYFARRYGLVEVATVAGFPGQEPSARWVADVVRAARDNRVAVVFAEPQLSPKAAETIAREIRGRVLMLDPIGGEGLPGRDRYADLMRYNAEVLAEAFASAR